MITPPELLQLAEQLARQPSEAAHRAAVSPAYYAAFLHLRQKVTDQGLYIPRKQALDHQRVETAVGKLSEPAQLWLSLLRKHRNVADYDIGDEFPADRVEVTIRAAIRLIQL